MVGQYSAYYQEQYAGSGQSSDWRGAVRHLVEGLVAQHSVNLHSVHLYGGLVRDGKPIPGWSDIDILVVFQDIRKRSSDALARLTLEAAKVGRLRIDLVQAELRELVEQPYLDVYSNGAILNALEFPGVVSELLWGTPVRVEIAPSRNESLQLSYIHRTLGQFREYLCGIHMADSVVSLSAAVPRLARWAFSIVRASLRLEQIWTHPYEESLPYAQLIYPSLDLRILTAMCEIRRDWIRKQYELHQCYLTQLECFVEDYVSAVLLRHSQRARSPLHAPLSLSPGVLE